MPTLNADALRLGVDLGGSKIFAAVFRGDEIVASVKKPTHAGSGYEDVVERLAKVSKQACKKAGLKLSQLGSFGVGVPGPVRRNVLLEAPNLGWRGRPLAEDLSHITGVEQVWLANDVNCGALGEALLGAGREDTSVFCLFIGTGLGGGWVDRAACCRGGILAPHEGSTGFAGEVGHIRVPGQVALCACGQRGCLETLTSKRGLARLMQEAVAAGAQCQISDLEALKSSQLEAAFRAGCPVTNAAVAGMALHLAWAMSTIASVINPSVFVLGGGVGERLGADLVPMIEAHGNDAPFVRAHGAFQIKVGTLGGAAVAAGASRLGTAQPP